MNRPIRRGDIFYITDNPHQEEIGSEIWANRPGLVVSNDALNRTSQCVDVIYLTTSAKKRPAPTHVEVKSGNKTAIAMCEQIHTVDKTRLTDFINSITPEEMEDVEGGMLFSLQINRGRNPQGIFRKYLKQLEKYQTLQEAYDISADTPSPCCP